MSSKDKAAAAETNATPSVVPLPSSDDSKESTDSQGVRRLDAESVKPKLSDSAASKKKQKTAPRSSAVTKVTNSTPVNDLRSIVSTAPPQEVRHSDYNWFIPVMTMLFTMLYGMNDKVCTLRQYGERGTINDWCPQSCVMVFSVLAIVQVLRAQQIVGLITPEQQQFLDYFVSRFPLESITIPGPLVPFFRSLSVCSPGFSNFQDVTPAIPPFTMNEELFYAMSFTPPGQNAFYAMIHMLPSIPLMMDQFVHLISYVLAGNVYSTYEVLRRVYNQPRPANAGPTRTWFDFQRRSLGFTHRPVASDGLMTRFANYCASHAVNFPTPWNVDLNHVAQPAIAAAQGQAAVPAVAAQWIEHSHIASFMQMQNTSEWFSIFLRGMDSYNSHWKGNQSFLSLHPSTSTAGLVLYTGLSFPAPAAQNVFNVAGRLNHSSNYPRQNTAAEHTCPFITVEDFQDSQIAQVNAVAHGLTHGSGYPGQLNRSRFGSYWTVTPNVVTTAQVDFSNELVSMATSSAYFDA
jgi:hypothetical protein